MRYLIVDDDMFSRELVKSLLEEYGECLEADDGKKAVAEFTKACDDGKPFDVVFMDITMPEMDGHEAARAIRQIEAERLVAEDAKVKIVMLTADGSEESATAAHDHAKSAAYLVKPVAKERLKIVIRALKLGQ